MFVLPTMMGSGGAGGGCSGTVVSSMTGTFLDGDCDFLIFTKMRLSVTLNQALPSGYKVQYRYGTSTVDSTPSLGSWTDWGTFSGTFDTKDIDYSGFEASDGSFLYPYTRFGAADVRVVSNDESDVCDTNGVEYFSIANQGGC